MVIIAGNIPKEVIKPFNCAKDFFVVLVANKINRIHVYLFHHLAVSKAL